MLERAFDVADRHRRPVPGVHGGEHPRPVHAGASARPTRRRPTSSARWRLPVRGQRRLPPADRRRDRALPRHARRDRGGAAPRLPDAKADLDHPLAQAGARPLGRRPRGGRRAGRAHAADQPADRQPLGRVGVAPAAARVCAAARRARARRSSSSTQRWPSSSTAARRTSSSGCGPISPAALAEIGRVQEARVHVDRCRTILDGGEDWRARAGMAAIAEAIVLAARGAGVGRRARLRRRAGACSRATASPATRPTSSISGAARSPRPSGSTRPAAILRQHGAGELWLQRVAADRRRFG